MDTNTVKFTDIDKALVTQAARIAELEDALQRIAALENDSDTSDLVVLRKALRIAVAALGKKEER